jgi:hypothetical protein
MRKTSCPQRPPAKRPGSVMIMVIALLVLLALMGTAWVASVRYDRGSLSHNVTSNRIDELAEGVVGMVSSRIDAGVRGYLENTFDQTIKPPTTTINYAPVPNPNASLPAPPSQTIWTYFRPRTDTIYQPQFIGSSPNPINPNPLSYTYYPYDCPLGDATAVNANQFPLNWVEQHAGEYLASRLPELVPNTTIVRWPAISAPLGSDHLPWVDARSGGNIYKVNDATRWFESPLPVYDAQGRPHVRYLRRTDMRPTFLSLIDADGTPRSSPAFDTTNGLAMYDAGDGTPYTPKPGSAIVAADTDGDGIADAGLWRLPISQQGGITWYAAVRIIDNNSALNVNTAWEWHDSARDNADAIPANLFPTNINLKSLIAGSAQSVNTQLFNLNDVRFGRSPVGTSLFTPYDDNGNPRSDFHFTSQYDALWHQLGARLDNPGHVTASTKYTSFPLTDQIALASRFVLRGGSAGSGLEGALYDTLAANGRAMPYYSNPSTSGGLDYGPVRQWFSDNFDFDAQFNTQPAFSRRPLFVTRNGVTDFFSPAKPNLLTTDPDSQSAIDVPYGPASDPVAVRMNINTASYDDLTLAFWNVMLGTAGIPEDDPELPTHYPAPPFGYEDGAWDFYDGMRFTQAGDNDPDHFTANLTQHPHRMFRLSMRPTSLNDFRDFDYGGQLYLRASIAATNAIAMRVNPTATRSDPGEAVYSNKAQLNAGSYEYDYYCYEYQPQPFLSEVYVSTDSETQINNQNNPNGYIAVELVNPYPFPIHLDSWALGVLDRSAFPYMNLTALDPTQSIQAGALSGITIPQATGSHYGYVVLHNFGAGSDGSANFIPLGAKAQHPVTNARYVNDLHRAIGKELFLLRPARRNLSDLDNTSNSDPWAPVDSFDFTGLSIPPFVPASKKGDPTPAPVTVRAWHYARANDKATHPWCFVYPGRYDGTPGPKTDRGVTWSWRGHPDGNPSRHQQGTQQAVWTVDPNNNATDTNPWAQYPKVKINLGDEDTIATYPARQVRPIQLCNTDQPSPGRTDGYPFGGFARDGDMLHVPFIGAYKLYVIIGSPTPNLMEMNTISMDAAYAEDTDPNDDIEPGKNPADYNDLKKVHRVEQIGRFCPIFPYNQAGPSDATASLPNDWDVTSTNAYKRWRYRWATRLYDYLATETPHSDYFPNRPADEINPLLNPVANADPRHANDEFEKTLGVQGLININTAQWKVLSTLPLSSSAAATSVNDDLAKKIVLYRDGDGTQAHPAHGAFHNVYDLYKVPEVWQYVKDGIINPQVDPDDADGDFTPFNRNVKPGDPLTDGVIGDYEERFLFTTRIGNMITTRSDTFTAYIVVQGWRDAGTDKATMVAQKRLGLIVDRSNCTVRNKKPHLIPFASD